MCPERDNGCEEEKGGDGRREMTKESGTKETKRTGACVVGGGGREGEWWRRVRSSQGEPALNPALPSCSSCKLYECGTSEKELLSFFL